jgi:hypothetical protein
MSRIYGKEILTELLAEEIEVHNKLLMAARPRADEAHGAGTLSGEAYRCLAQSEKMLDGAVLALKEEDFKKALHFLLRSVGDYYLMLGDKGVLKNGPKKAVIRDE